MSERLIILSAGNPASGKGSYGKHLVEAYGAVNVSMSGIIAEYAASRSLLLGSRTNFAAARWRMLDEFGTDSLAKATLAVDGDILHIDGLRVPEDQSFYHEHGGIDVAFEGSLYARFANSLNDSSRSRGDTIQEFFMSEANEYVGTKPFEISTLSVMRNAIHKVNIENKSLEQVHSEADALVFSSHDSIR